MRTLYTVPTANGQRASIALEECGLDYDICPVNLYDGEHRSAEMLEVNPFGRMPVLKTTGGDGDSETLYGSLAIGLYAAELTGRLLPPAAERPGFHEWIGIIMTDLVPAFSTQFYLGTLAPEPFPWGIECYNEIIRRFLVGIDQHLAENEYFVAGMYTLVDVLMYPTAATSVTRMQDGLTPYPHLARWVDTVLSRAAVQRGMTASS